MPSKRKTGWPTKWLPDEDRLYNALSSASFEAESLGYDNIRKNLNDLASELTFEVHKRSKDRL